MSRTTTSDRRAGMRYTATAPAQLHLTHDGRTATVDGRVLNLSRFGMFVETGARPKPSQTVLCSFVADDVNCVAAGIVSRVDQREGFAVSFEGGNMTFTLFSKSLDLGRNETALDKLSDVRVILS